MFALSRRQRPRLCAIFLVSHVRVKRLLGQLHYLYRAVRKRKLLLNRHYIVLKPANEIIVFCKVNC